MPGRISLGSTSAALGDIFDEVERGRIRVPQFQRPFVLRDDWVVSLLASVSLGYSVGAVMLLEAGAKDLRFKSWPLAGTPRSAAETAPGWFLVDGQQRVTALYQVLGGEGEALVQRDGAEPELRRYAIDVEAALEPGRDRDDAIRPLAGEAASRTKDPARGLFPLRLALDRSARTRWLETFIDTPGADRSAREQLARRFEDEVLTAFDEYRVPTIMLGKATTRWSVRVHGGAEGPQLSDQFRLP